MAALRGNLGRMDQQATPADDDKLISRQAAADLLGLREQTLRRWAIRRTGPAYIKVGRTVRYSLADLRAFLAAGRINNAA